MSKQQQLSLLKIILNSARQPLYGNVRKNQENINQEKYKMIYSQKQQCYACNQLNHITSNCEAFTVLINAKKMYQASYKN